MIDCKYLKNLCRWCGSLHILIVYIGSFPVDTRAGSPVIVWDRFTQLNPSRVWPWLVAMRVGRADFNFAPL